MNLNLHKRVASDRLKISFFRLHPGHTYESDLLKALDKNLGLNNYCAFKALGHYDIICVYPLSLEDKMYKGGTIQGIRSFSSMDCFCWLPDTPTIIVKKLKSKKLISVANATLGQMVLSEFGGIRNDEVERLCSKNDTLYLNSSAWGEQVVILCSERMSSLWEISQNILKKLKTISIDIHSVIGINIDFIKNIEQNKGLWKENIDNTFKVILNIRFILGNSQLASLLNQLKEYKLAGYQININSTIDPNEYIIVIHNGTWGNLIRFIRRFRNDNSENIISTRLVVAKRNVQRGKGGKIEENQGEILEPINKTNKTVFIPKRVCKKLYKSFPERVANLVIQTAHTVSDAYYDVPSDATIGSLVDATNNLIILASEKWQRTHVDSKKQRSLCIIEAEKLMRATYQRIEGIPATREFSRISFDVCPTNVRVFYEACEHVTSSLVNIFKENYSCWEPYVIIDNVDSPESTNLGVSLPIHLLNRLFTYTPLNHEALHLVINGGVQEADGKEVISEKMYSLQSIKNFCKNDRKKLKFLSEILVEILDFEITYMGQLDDYIDEEWSFFKQFFESSQKKYLEPKDLDQYIIRTFVVSLWNETKSLNVEASYDEMLSILFVPSIIRRNIRLHLMKIKDIMGPLSKENVFRFSNNRVYSFQQIIREMSLAISDIFKYSKTIIDKPKMKSRLKQMSNDETRKELSYVVDRIVSGEVVNRKIEFPDLIPALVSKQYRLIKDNKSHMPDESQVSFAMITSLWNSRQN